MGSPKMTSAEQQASKYTSTLPFSPHAKYRQMLTNYIQNYHNYKTRETREFASTSSSYARAITFVNNGTALYTLAGTGGVYIQQTG